MLRKHIEHAEQFTFRVHNFFFIDFINIVLPCVRLQASNDFDYRMKRGFVTESPSRHSDIQKKERK